MRYSIRGFLSGEDDEPFAPRTHPDSSLAGTGVLGWYGARPKDFWVEVQKCWPAVKGSVAWVRKPCIRPPCQACAEGRKHPAFLFACRQEGRPRCLHVPRERVPALRQALAHGRRLEALMVEMGVEMIRQYRRQRGEVVAPAEEGPG